MACLPERGEPRTRQQFTGSPGDPAGIVRPAGCRDDHQDRQAGQFAGAQSPGRHDRRPAAQIASHAPYECPASTARLCPSPVSNWSSHAAASVSVFSGRPLGALSPG
jgi:hypothetical protein